MVAFIVRRLISMLFVMFAISVLTYAIFFATPGVDPAARIAGRNATPAELAVVKHQFGLDRPFPIQYGLMMKKLFVTRDLTSFVNRGSLVLPQIEGATPVTLSLVIGAAIIWVVFAIAMGLAAAVFRGTFIDPLLMVVGLIGISMPVFWLGEVVNLITQDRLHASVFSWVPPLGYTPITSDPFMWFKQLLFPWLTLSALYIGFYGRVLRGNILDTINEDYVRTAHAKGLSDRQVLMRHILRNSLIPIISLWGLDMAQVIGGGAILTETVFGLHGVGQLAADSIGKLDIVPLLAIVLLTAFFVVFLNALIDILYAYLDPRIRLA
jgi:peptide/nickel transport system permease protein